MKNVKQARARVKQKPRRSQFRKSPSSAPKPAQAPPAGPGPRPDEVLIYVQLPVETAEAIEQFCAKRGVLRDDFIRAAILKWIDGLERQEATENPASPANPATAHAFRSLSKQNLFLSYLLLGSLAGQSSLADEDLKFVLHAGGKIPETAIPEDAVQAAEDFLKFLNGVTLKPQTWMLTVKGGGR
jgi:hypothetical protein